MRKWERPKDRSGRTVFAVSALYFLFLGAFDCYAADSAVALIGTCLYCVIMPLALRASEDVLPFRKNAEEASPFAAFKGIDFASVKFRKAVRSYDEHHYNDAIHLYKEVEEYKLSSRETAVLNFYMGLCYRDMGYPTNAAACMEKSDDTFPLHPVVLLNAGRCYTEAGNFFKAEEISDRMLEMKYDEDRYFFLWSERGRMFLRAGNPDRAIESLETGISKGLDLCGAYCGMAVAYLLKKEPQKSREYAEKAAVTGGMINQQGFYPYYAEVARSCGTFDEVRDIIPEEALHDPDED